ncbi:MAG: class I SAM-dependent methyltransferase [Bacteroidota bacterium]
MTTASSTAPIIYKSCPVCGSNHIAEVFRAKDYTVSQETFSIWHCEECQLRFTQNIPVEHEIGAYYQSEEYISHSNTSKGLINGLYQTVRDYTLKQKRKLVEKISGTEKGNILDIGCGTGEFLGTMKAAGWKTLGLEPDPGAREQVKTNQGVEVYDNEHLFSLADDSYDVISMWHVLEHVHRLHDYLDKIQSLLKPSGKFLVAVPNYQSVDADHYQAYWAAYDVPRHLYHFSPSAMGRLMSRHGFKIVEYRKMPFDAFYVSLLSEKYKHGSMRLVPAFWTGLRSFLKNSAQPKRGSSILYIIEKTKD